MPQTRGYAGISLTPKIADKLIRQCFTGQQNVPINQIRTQVLQLFQQKGGSPPKNVHVIAKSLTRLQNAGIASSSNYGFWSFQGVPVSSSSPVEAHPVLTTSHIPLEYDQLQKVAKKVVGESTGNGGVYVIAAQVERSTDTNQRYECKIGMASSDLHRRITQLLKTPSVCLLAIKTDQPGLLESALHKILKLKGREPEGPSGKEVFHTSAEEVEFLWRLLGLIPG